MARRALDSRQARLWNYLNGQDVFWPIRSWPNYLQDMALEAHKKRRSRFRLFQFLVFNGLSPGWAATWIQMRDYVKGEAVLDNTWTDKHIKHIVDMFRQLQDGTLFSNNAGNAMIFDMTDGRVVPGVSYKWG